MEVTACLQPNSKKQIIGVLEHQKLSISRNVSFRVFVALSSIFHQIRPFLGKMTILNPTVDSTRVGSKTDSLVAWHRKKHFLRV